MATGNWANTVLKFWFEELTENDWFSGDEAVDSMIRDRFLDLHAELAQQNAEDLCQTPEKALAAILVLDQFPRNAYRGTAKAFATDNLATRLARLSLEAGFDSKCEPQRRHFLYMPLMHSENLADQDLCVQCFRDADNENALKYAIDHRDVVARFGRFPHRNEALRRESTPEELAYLENAERYGQ